MTNAIITFNGTNAFLSNYSPSPLLLHDKTYPTVEHGYQAYRARIGADREAIRLAPTPNAAKRLAHTIQQRSDFDDIKLSVMEQNLRKKFEIVSLREQLLATGTAELVEGNYWHDNFWGVCVCRDCANIEGQNHLGQLLMKVRADLGNDRHEHS